MRSAEQVALGRIVAVKTLKPGKREPAASLDLLREAWVTGAIEHPNVVPIHYLDAEADGSPLIVMKRIEGVEWSALIDDAAEVQRRFGATDLLAWNLGILMQVLNAVRFAHHRGVLHRDLKPSNVMIGDFGEVYLLDWGIAVSLRDDGTGRFPLAANATDIAGTPVYMAPEMLGREGGPPLSERTDVYLAGAVLFELVAGTPPHTGASAIEVIASVIASTPVLPASVPVELARICTRAMSENPAQRFESVEALRLALQSYLEHRGSADLGGRALERLDELQRKLAATPIDREEIYRLFGACRFGFHEALAVWRDNDEARGGLVRATIAVAEYELAADNPDSAVTLLTELDDAPALLARARDAAAARHERTAELEKLRAAHDTSIGRRTRTFLITILGLFFTVAPLAASIWPSLWMSNATMLAFPLGVMGVILLFAWWAWGTLGATLFNRRIGAVSVFVFAAQALLVCGMWIAGASVGISQTCTQFLWAVCIAMLSITVDAWFTPAAIVYFVAFLWSARFPEHRMYVISASNAVFTINAVVRWRPDTFAMTAEEVAWLETRKRIRSPAGARARPRRPEADAPAPPSTDDSG